MKTLSVKQPFASLIVNGCKDVENRSRKTNYRGRILIHASALPAQRVPDIIGMETTLGQNLRSCILGSVEIVDCVRDHPSPWASPGSWHWVLGNAIRFEHPICNVKGSLSLWEYDTTDLVLQKAAELGAGICKSIDDCRECHVYKGCFKMETYNAFLTNLTEKISPCRK